MHALEEDIFVASLLGTTCVVGTKALNDFAIILVIQDVLNRFEVVCPLSVLLQLLLLSRAAVNLFN
jgi:hypothetical protein